MAADNHYSKRERKIRRKELLRAFRESQDAKMWNKAMDDVGTCDMTGGKVECYSFDFLNQVTDPEFEDPDEDYPNKAETLHNIFPCD